MKAIANHDFVSPVLGNVRKGDVIEILDVAFAAYSNSGAVALYERTEPKEQKSTSKK